MRKEMNRGKKETVESRAAVKERDTKEGYEKRDEQRREMRREMNRGER